MCCCVLCLCLCQVIFFSPWTNKDPSLTGIPSRAPSCTMLKRLETLLLTLDWLLNDNSKSAARFPCLVDFLVASCSLDIEQKADCLVSVSSADSYNEEIKDTKNIEKLTPHLNCVTLTSWKLESFLKASRIFARKKNDIWVVCCKHFNLSRISYWTTFFNFRI